jgi:hypothetical protein
MYISAPPIKVLQSPLAVLKVKEASRLHNLQIADSFLTLSHKGMSSVMFFHGYLKNVPYNDEITTIF